MGDTDELARIRAVLERAYPAAPPPDPWHKRAVTGFYGFLKYVGLPAAILAAILPVKGFVTGQIDRRNAAHIERTYLDYARELFAKGETARAGALMESLEQSAGLRPESQLLTARMAVRDALESGRNPEVAIDSAVVLVALSENTPPFFPRALDDDGLVDLQLAIVDMQLKNGQPAGTDDRLAALRRDLGPDLDPARDRAILLREARLAQTLRQSDRVREMIDRLKAETDPDWVHAAELRQLDARSHLLGGSLDAAHAAYLSSLSQDRVGTGDAHLSQIYERLGTVALNRSDWDAAEKYYTVALAFAERADLGRDAAEARRNLGVVYAQLDRLSEAEALSRAAMAFYTQQGNDRGLARSATGLSTIQLMQKKVDEALISAYTALSAGISSRHLPSVAGGAETIASIHAEWGIGQDVVFNLLLAYVLWRELGVTVQEERVVRVMRQFRASMPADRFAAELEDARRDAAVILGRIGRPDLGTEDLPF